MSSGRHARPSRSRRTAAVAAAALPLAAVAGAVLAPGTAQAAVPGAHGDTHQSGQIQATPDATAVAPSAPAVWVVRPGDSLSAIGAAVHIPWPRLWAANASRISNPNLIYPGQQLTESAGTLTAAQQSQLSPPPPAPAAAPVSVSHAVSHPAPPPVQDAAVQASAPRGFYDPPGPILTDAQIIQLWLSAGGPAWAAEQSVEVSECESTHNLRAYNPSGATGLWQILGAVVPGNLFDARVNALNAVSKFRASGDSWAQWVCKP